MISGVNFILNFISSAGCCVGNFIEFLSLYVHHVLLKVMRVHVVYFVYMSEQFECKLETEFRFNIKIVITEGSFKVAEAYITILHSLLTTQIRHQALTRQNYSLTTPSRLYLEIKLQKHNK
jgi:hypothetical protein